LSGSLTAALDELRIRSSKSGIASLAPLE